MRTARKKVPDNTTIDLPVVFANFILSQTHNEFSLGKYRSFFFEKGEMNCLRQVKFAQESREIVYRNLSSVEEGL